MGGHRARAGSAAGRPAGPRPIHAVERFDEFYLREYPATVTLALALSGSRLVAEDLAQEAFLAAWRQWSRIGGYEQPAAWVRRVVANLATSTIRRRLAEARAVVRMAAGRPPDIPEPSAATAEVWRAVRALPRRQAQVLALHYLLGCSVGEIATILDRSERTRPVQGSLGRVTASIPVCASPAGVEAGGGSLWVACPDDGVVVRVDPASGRVRARIAVSGAPGGLGVGAGVVWVALQDRDVLVRIDPATDRVTAGFAGPAYGSKVDFGMFHEFVKVPHRIGVTAQALWVPDVPAGTIVRIDPVTGARVAVVRLPDAGKLLPPAPGHLPLAVSVRNGIWASDVRSGLAFRIDPATNRVVARQWIIVPDGLTALGDDADWAQNGAEGGWVLRRVDLGSGHALGTLPVGRRVGGVAQAGGATWLTVTDQGVLLRVDS